MDKILQKIKNYWEMLGRTIYVEDRLEWNLRVDSWIGAIVAFICGIMTIMNAIQRKGFVTITTLVICVAGVIVFISARVLKNRVFAILTFLVIFVVIFTYYAISGVNDGFAILWSLLVPLAFCYFANVKYGVILSIYYELLFVILFYTPIRGAYMQGRYTETFMNRFPVLYFCGVLVNSIAMIQYHISTLKQIEYEKKLKEAADKAILADRAKSQFLAQMSHEIRTPINAVLGMNEMILHESKDPEILEYADNIGIASNTLLALINSILDFSKIEDGKMELVEAEYDTVQMINGLVISVETRAVAKGLEFKLDLDESLPSRLYGDDVRVSQVIMNLLTNAVKYTDSGHITLSVKRGRTDSQETELLVAVTDTGIGIHEEDMKRLFVSFERLEETKNRHIEGTGLGMSIVMKLLDLMGSSLEVKSEYGKGSCFSFVLRQRIADPTPVGNWQERFGEKAFEHKKDKLICAPSAKILVVDDNEMNLKVAKGLLKLCGISPDTVMSGEETIERMKEKHYDIVLLDHMMPGMDGIETLLTLKRMELIPENTTVIAMTANAVVGAREAYISAGFADYISKPVEIGQLTEKLTAYLPAEAYVKAETEPVINETGSSDDKKLSAAGSNNEKMMSSIGGSDDKMLSAVEPQEESAAERCYDRRSLDEAGFDTAKALTFCADDELFYFEVLDDYVSVFKEKSEELQKLYEAENYQNYRIAVHAIKSTSKTIGAMGLFEMAFELEQAAKNEDAGYIREHHDAMMKAYEETVKKICDIRDGRH